MTELRYESFQVAQSLVPLAEAHGKTMTQFSLNWVLDSPIVTCAIVGPRTMEQYEDNLGCLGWGIDDEARANRRARATRRTHRVGFNDPQYPVRGRPKT